MIVAGGGVLYSKPHDALAKFAEATGIPVCETQAGKGSLPYDHPQQLGAVGVTGTPGANILAREADLIIGIGTRYSDFTTASKTAFQNPAVRFININVAEFDAYKHAALPLTGDARVTLEELQAAVAGFQVDDGLPQRNSKTSAPRWEKEVDRIYGIRAEPPDHPGRSHRRGQRIHASPPTSWSARPAACPAICTNSGAPANPAAITWSTATPAWATKSPAAWA